MFYKFKYVGQAEDKFNFLVPYLLNNTPGR